MIALARRRCNALYALLCDGTPSEADYPLAAFQEHKGTAHRGFNSTIKPGLLSPAVLEEDGSIHITAGSNRSTRQLLDLISRNLVVWARLPVTIAAIK